MSETPLAPNLSSTEQRKSEVKEMAKTVLTTADAIIEEKKLSKDPKDGNFAWVFRGIDNARGVPSSTALSLKEATSTGSLMDGRRGLAVNFRYIQVEPGMYSYGNLPSQIAHNLTKDFVTRMGFSVPQNVRELVDKERRSVLFSDPEKPFNVECAIIGNINNEPQLSGFIVIPKTPVAV